MCGLCGVRSATVPGTSAEVRAMMRTLAHRGPDGEGLHAEKGLALGHRRLSIIDLSERAAEPMTNEDGTLWLVFNGEIYNFRELRKDLEARHSFRSQGDGEVILHLYEERGDEMVAALEGMFAFALWDARRERMLLARDRAGKKPLFYHDGPRLFAFASEPKALLAHPGVPRELDPQALPLFLTHGYVPTPRTFYAGIRSLPPGHRMMLTSAGAEAPEPYWRARFLGEDRGLDLAEAGARLRELLRAAVGRRLVADVPLGAFLSGGLDSSAIVALMAEQAEGRVRTFSIGFKDAPAYDETAYAREVSRRFATEHTEFVVEPRAMDLLDDLVRFHDAPFGDSSAVPMWLLAEQTRKHVTVALTGDGADEVFAGYMRFWGAALSEHVPAWAAQLAAAASRLVPEPRDRHSPRRMLKRFAEAGPLPLAERYLEWTGVFTGELTRWLQPRWHAAASSELLLAPYVAHLQGNPGSTLDRILQLNFETYLPDDLLVKADRMSMAHGLELRSPFLDREVVEFGARLPDRLRIRRGRGKQVLRAAMKDFLPPSVTTRKKMGFGVPLALWFRGDAAAEVHRRLTRPQSPLFEHVRPEPIAELLSRHEQGREDASARLFSLLTLESWLRQGTP
jgi:asparagine synthase (glutamine-hydrolysing)